MREVPVALGLALAALAVVPASGHVLDQFVEASRLELARDRVVVELDLTPGIELAPAMFVAINTNRDGEISEAEGRSHAAQVLADLALEVDGRRLDLELSSATYPTFNAMRAGTGIIRLRAVASTYTSIGAHRLQYQNKHRSDVGIYLVNALVPTTNEIELGTPHRDQRQQSFDLDYVQKAMSGTDEQRSGVWWLPGIGVLVGWAAYGSARRWRRRGPVAQL